jgi:hypothetical protein
MTIGVSCNECLLCTKEWAVEGEWIVSDGLPGPQSTVFSPLFAREHCWNDLECPSPKIGKLSQFDSVW